MWRFRTGSPWRDLPADYGAWQTIYWRFNTWSKDGTFNRILAELQAEAYGHADLEWTVSIDSSKRPCAQARRRRGTRRRQARSRDH